MTMSFGPASETVRVGDVNFWDVLKRPAVMARRERAMRRGYRVRLVVCDCDFVFS